MQMSDQMLMEGLQEALSDTMENMAFIEITSAETLDGIPAVETEDFMVSITVSKPIAGKLYMFLPADFVDELAETIAEEEVTMEFKKDLLAELMNTIAGRFLANIFPKQEFEMGLPECCAADNFSLTDQENHIMMSFDAEGQELKGVFEYKG